MSLHVKIFGAGPDLVLLHGWAMHGGIWSGVRDRLAQHFRLHLVDLPGHGSSPACGSGTLQCVVDTVVEILPASCMFAAGRWVGRWQLNLHCVRRSV